VGENLSCNKHYAFVPTVYGLIMICSHFQRGNTMQGEGGLHSVT